MKPFLIRAVAACILGVTPPVSAYAQEPSRMSDAELQGLRGGFVVANGVQLDFGAVVRTYVDGQLALESRLTWTETGAVTNRTTGQIAGAADLAAAMDAAMAQGLDLSGLSDGHGILLSDAQGATALIQNLNGGIQNLIVNNADGRDLRQEIEVTLTLPDLASMQRSYSIERLGAQIGQDVNAAMLQSLSR